MTAEEINVLEMTGLSAVCCDSKWIVGKHCTVEIEIPPVSQTTCEILGDGPWFLNPTPKPTAFIKMRVYAIAPTLREGQGSSLRRIARS